MSTYRPGDGQPPRVDPGDLSRRDRRRLVRGARGQGRGKGQETPATRCVLCSAAGGDRAGWTVRRVMADVVWVNQLDHTPALIEPAGQHHACAGCSAWLDGDRTGLPAGTLHLIGDALDQATAAGVADHQTRRALRDELVGQARTLADCIE